MGDGRKIVIPGGSGFLGGILAPWLAKRGWTVVVLSRRDAPVKEGVRMVPWDGRSLGDWAAELEQAAAVVNLAGRSVNCRYHRRNREQILASRIASTRVLGEAIARCKAARPFGSTPAPPRFTTHAGSPHGRGDWGNRGNARGQRCVLHRCGNCLGADP